MQNKCAPVKTNEEMVKSIRDILNERYGHMEIDDKYGKLARASKDAFILALVYADLLKALDIDFITEYTKVLQEKLGLIESKGLDFDKKI